MSTRSLKDKLKKIRATLPPPAPSYCELPIEEWVAEEVGQTPPDWYLKNTTDEERFYEWLEDLPKQLMRSLLLRSAGARGDEWDPAEQPVRPLPPEVFRRALEALPPHIEHQRRLWADNFPSREDRRRWVAEMERLSPEVKTRDNGYKWWLDAKENYARLRAKYSGFEEEWAGFYEKWQQECERDGRNAPMNDHMGGAFIHVCFLRGEHGGEGGSRN